MKALIDSTGSLWLFGRDGRETCRRLHLHRLHAWRSGNNLPDDEIPLIHLGMIIVGVPYRTEGMLHRSARRHTYGAKTIRDPRVSFLLLRKTWPSAVSRVNESLNSRKKSVVKRA